MTPKHTLPLATALIVGLAALLFSCKTSKSPAPTAELSTPWSSATGTWYGNVDAMGSRVPLVLHLSTIADSVVATMDSPMQKTSDIKVNTSHLTGDSLLISHTAMGMTMRLAHDGPSDEITAVFSQSIVRDTLTMSRDSMTIGPPPRPQHPTTFPYTVEDVTFDHPSGDHSLAGTLTIPDGEVIATVALVSGSGPNDRDETIMDHKIFLVLSDFLTRHGIAVLRYDDRGIGESTGNHNAATSADLSEDAAAAVDYLRRDARLASRPIGLMGHSEGGMIAWIANGMTQLDFIVSLAGPGLPIKELMIEQIEISAGNSGATEAELIDVRAQIDTLYTALIAADGLPISDFITDYRKTVEAAMALPAMRKSGKGMDDAMLTNSTIMGSTTPWFRYFIKHDPTPYLEQVRCPVLAVNGTSDQQVTVRNLDAIKETITANGNPKVDVQAFDNINHLFQYDPSGKPENYSTNQETFNENVLYFVSDWIHAMASER